MIKRYRVIYFTATIIFLLSIQRFGYALSYWDAIFEIGFNPETQLVDTTNACSQIERLVGFRNAIHELPVFDEKLNNKIQQVESQILSLDAGNLYYQLPYSENKGMWRGIGIRGGLDDDYYRLGIVDPEIENWVNPASNELPEPWGPKERFGDFGLRAFIRPVMKDTYRLAAEGHTYIDDLNPANLIRVVEQLVRVMSLFSENGDDPPSEFFKGSNLDAPNRRVIHGFSGDFPHFFEMFDQYFAIENVVSDKSNGSDGPKPFDMAIRIKVDAFKKDYPHIGKLMARLRGMLNFQATVFDTQNRSIGSMTFDGNQHLFSLRFRTRADRFLVLDENPNTANENGIGLTDLGHRHFYLIYSFRLNIAGMKLNIEDLKVNLNYFFDDYGANVKAEVRQPPKEITAEGLVMGFLPIWLIDFFIPSNIEDMTRQFFQTLATGNNGDGVAMYFGSIPAKSSKKALRFLTDAEVLSNGTMKFAHNLQRKMVREENELVEDIKLFEQQLWKAFYRDFLREKSLGFCGEK